MDDGCILLQIQAERKQNLKYYETGVSENKNLECVVEEERKRDLQCQDSRKRRTR